ncbi:ubinuclein-2-like [Rutidosis leptorrhynchoides]|uniref:ubinuclein-2-like n=1 Tax=Rutidosis leptorrhynchoides TaxID=125765 RepID=UPI003A9909DA
MENANKSYGATAAAAVSGGGSVRGGRLLVDESCSDRKRFEIELKEGETTIVSWAKLLKDSGISVDKSPPSSPDPKRLQQENQSKSKCCNITLKKKMDDRIYRPPTRQKTQSAISEFQEGMAVVQTTKNTKTGHARVKSITLTRHISEEEQTVNNAKLELPDLNVPYTVQTASICPAYIEDESRDLVNKSVLENSILEIETMVSDSTRPLNDLQGASHSVTTKSRLPRELKKKLRSVARLAHLIEGRISDELSMRLMSILGHWLKPRTLKRCLHDVAPSHLSAWGGDDVRFRVIEKEVVDMIKLRIRSMKTMDEPSNTMELCAVYKANYSMDSEMEDKVCDFYDIYVQGMDEIKSSEIRKFYIQLASLWPKGTMDNHGIRNAICRSKERRRVSLREKEREYCNAEMDEDLKVEAKLVSDSEILINDNNAPDVTFQDGCP